MKIIANTFVEKMRGIFYLTILSNTHWLQYLILIYESLNRQTSYRFLPSFFTVKALFKFPNIIKYD
jgi:hypothetical protein